MVGGGHPGADGGGGGGEGGELARADDADVLGKLLENADHLHVVETKQTPAVDLNKRS